MSLKRGPTDVAQTSDTVAQLFRLCGAEENGGRFHTCGELGPNYCLKDIARVHKIPVG